MCHTNMIIIKLYYKYTTYNFIDDSYFFKLPVLMHLSQRRTPSSWHYWGVICVLWSTHFIFC